MAQPIQKSAVNVDPGNTKLTGATFGYRLTYSCNNTLTDCSGARVVDLLPPEVDFIDTIPASPGGDVAAINVTPNFMGTGRTQVEFVMVDPLTAGNSGDLLINVRFPNGSTPDGTVATNTADGVNLETTPGTVTTPPVDVTAVASPNVTVTKTLLTNPALLDTPVSYRLRMSVSGGDGSLDVSGATFSDTLPPGAVYQGSTPAADCEPGCVGAVAPALVWSGPFSIAAGARQDITVTVIYPSATFMDGESVTNSFTTTGTPLGEPADSYGPGESTHDVEVFTPDPRLSLAKRNAGPNPPTFNQTFDWQLDPRNTGNVPLDNFVVVDTLPIEVSVLNVTSGRYNNAPASVVVEYETNTSGGFLPLGTNVTPGSTNQTYPIPGLGAGEYVTRVRWTYGQAPAGMISSSTGNRPVIRSQVINPDNLGSPVMIGDPVQNCADLNAVYDPMGVNTPVSDLNNCRTINVSGPYVQFSPTKDRLTAGGPFNVGQTIRWRLRVRSNGNSSDPIPLENVTVVDLLPVDLVYTPASFTYVPNGTGLPAPTLEVIDNYDATGRTLLRWTWPPASGSLAPNQEPRLEFDTTVRFGASFGTLTNAFGITENDPGLDQRCSSSPDVNDLDGDGDRTDRLCTASRDADIAPIAQLVSNKTVLALCDPTYTSSSAGTLLGGNLTYRLRVQNVGTVPMEDFVIVDILPAVGDTGVLDTNPRSSLWTPILTAPIIPPPGTTVFYSTSQNPCRGEVGGPTSGCDPPNWTTVAPTPITSVRSFKIEFGDRVLNPADFLEFTFQLTAPGDAPTGGEEAFNSFAYLGERSDGLGSLSAEPNKVGTAIGSCDAAELGDFVWVDTDGDGVQNDGPTGVDNVFVELFTPGADGVPRTFDDIPLASTVTGTSPLGDPGWYQFPNLAPGSYYVLFHPPPTYAVTVADAGADDALDSDIDPATACSPLVVLAMGESNQTIDAGLLPPIPAALGDYVWFDRDAEGDQDESPFFGANGVTVRLYVDDGDGVPEPGGDDGTAVRTTATTNDIHGRPGYYLFDLLTPGVPYFVEFVMPASATGFTIRDATTDDVDSDPDTGTGLTSVVTLAPGEVRLDIDAGLIAPVGDLSLGDQVWCDDDDDGVFEPEDGELGVDGVRLDLYLDANADGEPTLDEFVATTTTFTAGGFAGRYNFDTLDAADYLVVVDLGNFAGGGPLEGKTSSTGNDPAPDPDDDVNGDDNGTDIGAVLASQPVTLVDNGEPTADDGDDDTNLTVDFGFTTVPATPPPEYDYGDNPDVVAGSGVRDYRTTALDTGAVHPVGVTNAPYLGDCVDADDGFAQSVGADGDDLGSFGSTVGTCAVPGDDEDGVTLPNPVTPGSVISIDVRAATGTNACVLDAWIDWDADGVFEAGEQIATSQVIASGTTETLMPLVPPITEPGLVYSRFRCSTAGGLGPEGFALDGEVEDYLVAVVGSDLGDAPDSYGTLLASSGAVHDVDPSTPFYLGACVDTDSDGQPDIAAAGDDVGLGATRVGVCLDDEDGVAFATPPVVCQMSMLVVDVNAAGVVDGWIDWGSDGTFDDPVDRVLSGQAVAAGSNMFAVMVPCNAASGLYYARYRLSSAGVAGPTGPAPDGEVEDYQFAVLPANDLGDAPDSYGTTLASDGARHAVTGSSAFLGACVDAEGDAGMPFDATGDDVTVGPATVSGTCVGNDDEDGVAFDTEIVACENAQVTVTASVAATLDGWIDFGGDGTFDAGDRIANNQAVAAGATALMVSVPCSATPGSTYARFRLSAAGVAGPTGASPDGEIEDYAVAIVARDWGDAPDSYGTTAGAGGPRHDVAPGTSLYLGSCVDTEGDAQAPLDTTGDDVAVSMATVAGTCVADDDEDGVTFPTLTACFDSTVTVTAGAAGLLDGWIDFGGDGVFDPSDRVANGLAVAAGGNAVTVSVPCDAVPGPTASRFRLSSTGVAGPTGPAADGEVEDHPVTIEPAEDWGDAPDPSFPTLSASNGARHVVLATGNPTLGPTVDAELDGQPSALANGDDTAAAQGIPDDEDGVVFPSVLVPGTDGTVEITAGPVGGQVSAWCDLDQDGTWAGGEQIATDLVIIGGTTETVMFPVPPFSPSGSAVCRFRISTAGGLGVTGPAADGEIEDHLVAVGEEDPQIGVAKRLVDLVADGDSSTVFLATLAIDIYNFGNVPLDDVQAIVELAVGFADAAGYDVVSLTSPDFAVNPAFDGDLDTNLLDVGNTLPVGGFGAITLVVRIDSGGHTGPYYCSSTATGTSPEDETVEDDSQEGDDPDPNGNGDPTDDDDPVIINLPVNVIEVPTLDHLGLGALIALLLGLGLMRARRVG